MLEFSVVGGPFDGTRSTVRPDDRAADTARKVAEYLSVGVRLLWVIDPGTRTAVVYRPRAEPRKPENGTLDGEDVLPGFTCTLSDLLG
jgi:Uma2 family endonuclease